MDARAHTSKPHYTINDNGGSQMQLPTNQQQPPFVYPSSATSGWSSNVGSQSPDASMVADTVQHQGLEASGRLSVT